MHGHLFTLFSVPFPAYFTLLVTGFIFATAVGALWAKRVGQDPDVVVDLGLAMLIAGVVGGRLLHVLADGFFWDYVNLCVAPEQVNWRISRAECLSAGYSGVWDAALGVCHPLPKPGFWDSIDRCTAWIQVWRSGFAFYGGFVLASITAWYALRRDRFPFWKAADMAGIAVPLGLGFGRMGCHLAGCCFGSPTDAPWALVFPSGSAASEVQWKANQLASAHMPSLPVHPAQIYESLGSLTVAAVLLLWFHGRKRYDGHVFVVFMAAYGVLRFVLELVRADDRGGFLGLSTSQLIGVGVVATALVLHRQLSQRTARRMAARTPQPSPSLAGGVESE